MVDRLTVFSGKLPCFLLTTNENFYMSFLRSSCIRQVEFLVLDENVVQTLHFFYGVVFSLFCVEESCLGKLEPKFLGIKWVCLIDLLFIIVNLQPACSFLLVEMIFFKSYVQE